MRHRFAAVLCLVALPWAGLFSQAVSFDDYFIDKTLRVDYFHIGDAKSEEITIDRILVEGPWAGSTKHLVDPFNLGRYEIKAFDVASGTLIFSHGFESYFGEYRTTTPAINGVKRTYQETALLPLPKKPIRFVFQVRDRANQLHTSFQQIIDPDSTGVLREGLMPGVKTIEVVRNGDPHRKLDLVILAEGYTQAQETKFESDLRRYADIFFHQPPFDTLQSFFNVYGVFKASADSNCDEPEKGIFRNTVLNSSFYALNLDRYLLTEDNRTMHDLAAHVPYDKILIMVNHTRYGGGGIYNLYCIFTSDNQRSPMVFVHEFGHAFAGLADEYYNADVAYNDFYPAGVEPLEPNITALLDPANLKWKRLVSSGTPIPTPWQKQLYDSLTLEFPRLMREMNRRIGELKKQNTPNSVIQNIQAEFRSTMQKNRKQIDMIFEDSPFRGKVGAFEGAGYTSKGLYRPMLECLMFSRSNGRYCDVCADAIARVIRFYGE
jgi:hypothetical protein